MIHFGDCKEIMQTWPDQSVQMCVTSPPYFGLRDYGHAGQIGLEQTPDAYVAKLVDVFREVRRLLRDDGTLWLNLGDSYSTKVANNNNTPNANRDGTSDASSRAIAEGLNGRKLIPDVPNKNLLGIPWRVAFALQADGWYLRQDIIWAKPNPMPESVRDRCTKAHEYIFLLSKSERYYFDAHAIAEPLAASTLADSRLTREGYETGRPDRGFPGQASKGSGLLIGNGETRNKRSVWTVTTKPFKGAHFATFPPDLIEPCILAGCPPVGKRCDCDVVIETPTGTGPINDPSMLTGRSGMNRPRRPDEGTRPITRREQRWHAEQMKQSPNRDEMAAAAGDAFAHYIRTDLSGARPLPESLRVQFMNAGWITEAPPCDHPIEPAGTVLDPFMGSGTTAQVAIMHGRQYIGCELNPEYKELQDERIKFAMDQKRQVEMEL